MNRSQVKIKNPNGNPWVKLTDKELCTIYEWYKKERNKNTYSYLWALLKLNWINIDRVTTALEKWTLSKRVRDQILSFIKTKTNDWSNWCISKVTSKV